MNLHQITGRSKYRFEIGDRVIIHSKVYMPRTNGWHGTVVAKSGLNHDVEIDPHYVDGQENHVEQGFLWMELEHE